MTIDTKPIFRQLTVRMAEEEKKEEIAGEVGDENVDLNEPETKKLKVLNLFSDKFIQFSWMPRSSLN